MNTVYLVDLENVGTKLLYQHVENHQDAEYIIFYSNSTSAPDTILEQIPETVNITFTNCKTGGNNAMDFCICAMAGRMSINRTRKIRILSDDKGYDSMIHMLQEQGIRIAREITTYQQELKTDPIPVSVNDQTSLIAAIRKNVPKKYQDNMIKMIPNTISRKEAHEICQAILPQNMATDIYRKLKKHIPKEVR